jgi:glycerol kinase
MCYKLGDNDTQYALEGGVEMAGAAIEWATKVGIVKKASEMEAEALTVDDCGDVYFVPAFQGIFAPHWNADARGLMIGMSLNTERGHLMRALLEAPCLRSAEVVEAMSKDANCKIERMVVDGGMTVNNLLMQMQSDFTDAEIVRKEQKEITAIGAAIAAGLQVGFWPSLEAVEQVIKVDRVFKP